MADPDPDAQMAHIRSLLAEQQTAAAPSRAVDGPSAVSVRDRERDRAPPPKQEQPDVYWHERSPAESAAAEVAKEHQRQMWLAADDRRMDQEMDEYVRLQAIRPRTDDPDYPPRPPKDPKDLYANAFWWRAAPASYTTRLTWEKREPATRVPPRAPGFFPPTQSFFAPAPAQAQVSPWFSSQSP